MLHTPFKSSVPFFSHDDDILTAYSALQFKYKLDLSKLDVVENDVVDDMNHFLSQANVDADEEHDPVIDIMRQGINNYMTLCQRLHFPCHTAFNWQQEFPQIFKKGGFDVVIGNPPYVDIKALDNDLVKQLFKNYKTAENRINLYSIFKLGNELKPLWNPYSDVCSACLSVLAIKD